jgi:membrane protease YdiL (CAAX protease family)
MTTGPLSARTCARRKTPSRMGRTLSWRGTREVTFWLLLLGSWQFLAASGVRNGIIGSIGTAAFLIFARLNLDQLSDLGLDHARWWSVRTRTWLVAIAAGSAAAAIVFALASRFGDGVRLSDDRKLMLLQVTLGPVLEEILFRGYLFGLLLWVFAKARKTRWNVLVIPIAALVFAVVHLNRPGASWLQMACITSTGAVYGSIRYSSGSSARAAVAHAAYNLALYAIGSGMKMLAGIMLAVLFYRQPGC